MSKAESIRGAPKYSIEPVVCNEWRPANNGTGENFVLYARSMSATGRNELGQQFEELDNLELRFRTVTENVFDDETGEALTFSGFSLDEFSELHTAPVERLFNRVLRLSGITQQDQEIIEGK